MSENAQYYAISHNVMPDLILHPEILQLEKTMDPRLRGDDETGKELFISSCDAICFDRMTGICY